MAFGRWDPIRDLLAIQHRLDRFGPGSSTGWVPPVDLHETADRYVVSAEIPGLRREDVEIRIHDSHLTLSGVRRDAAAPCEQYHRIERGRGAFSRTFELPVPVLIDDITADLKDGVLVVIVPKARGEATRRIQVS